MRLLDKFVYGLYATQVTVTGIETNFSWEIYNVKCLHLFTIRNPLEIPHTIFQLCHPGYFMADAMQNPYRLSILGCVLKPKAVEGAFQNR